MTLLCLTIEDVSLIFLSLLNPPYFVMNYDDTFQWYAVELKASWLEMTRRWVNDGRIWTIPLKKRCPRQGTRRTGAVLWGKARGKSSPRSDCVSLNTNQITRGGGARVNGGHMKTSVTLCERGGDCATQTQVQEALDITRRGGSSNLHGLTERPYGWLHRSHPSRIQRHETKTPAQILQVPNALRNSWLARAPEVSWSDAAWHCEISWFGFAELEGVFLWWADRSCGCFAVRLAGRLDRSVVFRSSLRCKWY